MIQWFTKNSMVFRHLIRDLSSIFFASSNVQPKSQGSSEFVEISTCEFRAVCFRKHRLKATKKWEFLQQQIDWLSRHHKFSRIHLQRTLRGTKGEFRDWKPREWNLNEHMDPLHVGQFVDGWYPRDCSYCLFPERQIPLHLSQTST